MALWSWKMRFQPFVWRWGAAVGGVGSTTTSSMFGAIELKRFNLDKDFSYKR